MQLGIGGRALSFVLISGLAVVACGGGAVATGTPTSTAAPSPTPSQVVGTLKPSAIPSASASPTTAPTATASPAGGLGGSPTGQPVAVDPCTLLTSDEVNAVNGVTYPAGVPHDMSNGGVDCVWQSPSAKSSVTIQVVQAPSVTDADVAWAKQQALLKGFALEQLTGYGDDAVIARASAAGHSTGGIYVRKGSTFFDIVYLNGTPPTDDVLTADATKILGELP